MAKKKTFQCPEGKTHYVRHTPKEGVQQIARKTGGSSDKIDPKVLASTPPKTMRSHTRTT